MSDRTWTVDELVDAYERVGMIEPPFTPDERALAQSVAAAFHFAFSLEELPGRCLHESMAYGSLHFGISQVNQRRKDQTAGQAINRGRGRLAARPSGRVHAPRR